MGNKVVLKGKLVWGMEKCMVSMATGNAILMNWGRPRNSIISQLLLILDNKPWYQIKGWIQVFYPMVRYTTYLMCIFMNINETLQNDVKS